MSSAGRGGVKKQPKAKATPKVEVGAVVSQAQELLEAEKKTNAEYLALVVDALNTIKGKWPDIETRDPLPLPATNQPAGTLTGFMAPYDPKAYTSLLEEGTSANKEMSYTCGLNMMFQNILLSMMPWVPIIYDDVLSSSKTVEPGCLTQNFVLAADFDDGKKLPRGSLVRMSPDELCHKVIFRVAGRIKAGAAEAELEQWLRTMLSSPVTFKVKRTQDEQTVTNTAT